MSNAKKPRKSKYDPLAAPDNASEVAAVYSCVAEPGPKSEGGPAAWVQQPWTSEASLERDDIWGAALTSLAARRGGGPIIDSTKIKLVIVITDASQEPDDITTAIKMTASITGTFTEARRLVDKVRWLDFCEACTVPAITKIVSNELALALADHPELTRDNVLFLVWKERKSSFGGITKLELAREICHEVFTVPDLAAPSVYSDGYDDGHKDDDKDRADWWKGGGK